MSHRRLALLALPLLLGLGACSPKQAFQAGIPGTATDFAVSKVTPRDGYLDAELHGSGFALRTFTVADEVCSRVLAGEQGLRFIAAGSYGTLTRGEDRCEAAGIGSLAEWRKKRPRADASVIPSARASFRQVYSDEEVVLLRGDFPLGNRLGFTCMGDCIAVVPNAPICQRPIETGNATMEFFPGGKNVLTLSGAEGRCPVEGLIRPRS